ncbi:MAG: ATP-binding cassette, subfamily bacterial [Actinomycetota bacterium]|nr:ATP-binding cassette, subfamily bacterial [Actinomycetota bacterium]
MSMGQGMSTWHAMRSFTQDSSVTKRKLAPGTVKRIVKFAAPYKRLIAILLVLLVIDAAVGAVTPLLIREILNQGIGGHRPHLVVGIASIIALIAVLDAGLMLAQRYLSSRIGEGLIFDMRAKIFGHIQKMPIAFFTRTQTGALISRLNNDVLGAQQAFTSTLSSVVSNLLTVTFTLAVMFALSWQITLVALALLPVFVLPARWFGRKLQTITRESYNLNAAMNNTMNERFNVAGALLVKLFGRPKEEESAFRSKAGRVRDIGVTQSMYGGVFFTSLMLVASLGAALVYGWGGWLAATRRLDVGTVVALGAYLTRLYGPLTALSNVNVSIMTALVSFERVFEVLDLPPMIDDAPDAVDLPARANTVEFEHVDFRYPAASEVSVASLESVAILDTSPNTQVLYDVSFKAEPGQLVALVGPSGAGKSTISSLVSRLYDVTGGVVRIGGVDVRQATMSSLREIVGVVTQDSHMFHDTVRANLAYAKPDATEDDLIEACKAAQIWDLVSSLTDGLDTLVGERGYRLSGGEKQRLALARLLLKAPSIVVLDEATAHLDSESEAAVQRALKTALAGRTSLVIAHRLSTIREADQILVIDEGRIVERGHHDDLLIAGGLYAELYRTQFERQAVAELEDLDLADVAGEPAAG